jgi:exosortase
MTSGKVFFHAMAQLTPILPVGAGAAAAKPRQHSPAPAAPSPAPLDEGIIQGFRRRLSAFATDLRKPEEATAWTTIAVLSSLLIYSYWPGLLHARSFWDNPQYQHGWIVPVINLVLLVWRRQPITRVTTSARLAGLGLLVASFALRVFAANFRIITVDMYTFVPALAGVFLLAGGWSMFRWAWAPIALTIFMYPLPDEAQRYITGPLQLFNTTVAAFTLQTLGFDAVQEGNLIRLGSEHVMNVVDACAGLKMLTIFVWLCALVIVVAGLEWWENVLIAVSAIPIAILANAFRITTAGMLYGVSTEMAEGFHDSAPAALLMMAIAVGFILLEMKLLSYLIVKEEFAPASLVSRVSPTKNTGFPSVSSTSPRSNGGDPGRAPLAR